MVTHANHGSSRSPTLTESLRVFIAILFVAISALSIRPASAQCVERWTRGDGVPGVIGPPSCSIMWDPDGAGPRQPVLVVGGGSMTIAGTVNVSNIAVLDGQEWSSLGAGFDQGYEVGVKALAVLPSGELVAGGAFISSGGAPVKYISRWNGLTWTTLGEGLDSPVQALAVLHDGRLVAAGKFKSAGGVANRMFAVWDGVQWSALNTGDETNQYGYVSCLAVAANGDLIAGGNFSMIGGKMIQSIARWDDLEWMSMNAIWAWDYRVSVEAIAVLPDGRIAVSVTNTQDNPRPFGTVLVWNGLSWAGLGDIGGTKQYINALAALPNGDLVAGGSYFSGSTIGGFYYAFVLRWDGASWQAMNGDVGRSERVRADNSGVSTLTPTPSGEVFVGGSFNRVGDQAAENVARWSNSGWSSFGTGLNNDVGNLLVLPNGDLIASGDFHHAGGTRAEHIARWDGACWSPLAEGLDGYVSSVEVTPSGRLVAGGFFTKSGATAMKGIASWDGTAWRGFGDGLDGGVGPVAILPNGDVIAGGYFLQSGSTKLGRVVCWHNGVWKALGNIGGPVPYFDPVYSLAVEPNGDIIAAGDFEIADGQPVHQLARWNGTTWLSLGTGLNGSVRSILVLPSGDLLVAGNFTSAGGNPANSIARWDGTEWSSFANRTETWRVGNLTFTPNGHLLVSASFHSGPLNGKLVLSRWDNTAWTDLPVDLTRDDNPRLGSYLSAIASLPDGSIAIGGLWDRINGLISPNFGLFACLCAADTTEDGYVTGDDFDQFAAAYAAGAPEADLNADGFVTGDDFDAFVEAFANGC